MRCAMLLVVTAAFSAWYASVEAVYGVSGRVATGTVVRATPTTVGLRRYPKLEIDYEYPDSDGPRRGRELIDPGPPLAAGSAVEIEFLPGMDISRLWRAREPLAAWLLAASVGAGLTWYVSARLRATGSGRRGAGVPGMLGR